MRSSGQLSSIAGSTDAAPSIHQSYASIECCNHGGGGVPLSGTKRPVTAPIMAGLTAPDSAASLKSAIADGRACG